MRYRSTVVPTVAMMALVGMVGCEPTPEEKAKEAAALQAQAQKVAAINKAREAAPPSQETLSHLRTIAQDFVTEHHPELTTQGFEFTQLTPNLFFIGARVTDIGKGNQYTKQLTAERLRDTENDEDGNEVDSGEALWIIDYPDDTKLKALCDRHGLRQEVDALQRHPDQMARQDNNFMTNMLLWHCLFNRPQPIYYGYGSGFAPMDRGSYFGGTSRFAPSYTSKFSAMTAATGGRSSAFISGRAFQAPSAAQVGSSIHGKPFTVGRSGITKGAVGSVSKGTFSASRGSFSAGRSSFGSAGRASGGFGGG